MSSKCIDSDWANIYLHIWFPRCHSAAFGRVRSNSALPELPGTDCAHADENCLRSDSTELEKQRYRSELEGIFIAMKGS